MVFFLVTLKALSNIHHLIGNGKNIYFWFDPKWPCGRLVDAFSERTIHDLGLGRDIKVSSIIRDGSWSLPHARTHQVKNIF